MCCRTKRLSRGKKVRVGRRECRGSRPKRPDQTTINRKKINRMKKGLDYRSFRALQREKRRLGT